MEANVIETKRIELHNKLLSSTTILNVYFQPPENIKIVYPCIIYERQLFKPRYADDTMYSNNVCYKVILVDSKPNNENLNNLLIIKNSKYVNHYYKNSLHYDVFSIYIWFGRCGLYPNIWFFITLYNKISMYYIKYIWKRRKKKWN